MVYYKPADELDQWFNSTTPEEFINKTKEQLVWSNQFFRGEYAAPYFDTDSANIYVDDNMRTVYVYIRNKRSESFFAQFDFSDPIDSVYVNHQGDTVSYFNRVLCVTNFFDVVKESAEYDLEDLGRRLKEELPYTLFALKGRLSVVGGGAIVQGNVVFSDEFSLNFKLCTQFVADEEHKEILSRLEERNDSSACAVDVDSMDGHEFESFCANLLRSNDFSDVEVTKGSGDQGIDILATKDFVKYGFQCKCYSSDVGNKAIQEAHAGKTYYGCHVAVVLTNRYFTPAAKELAAQTGVVLWDRDVLASMGGFDGGFASADDSSLSGDEQALAQSISEMFSVLQETLVSSNHQDDGNITFGIEDEDLKNLFLVQILQYMFWIINAGVGASDKDARVINIVTSQELTAEEIDSLIFEDFIPDDFEFEEPSAVFSLARLMNMMGIGDPNMVILPIYESIGELLVSIELLWKDERKERVEEYCSMLRRNASMI